MSDIDSLGIASRISRLSRVSPNGKWVYLDEFHDAATYVFAALDAWGEFRIKAPNIQSLPRYSRNPNATQ